MKSYSCMTSDSKTILFPTETFIFGTVVGLEHVSSTEAVTEK